MFSSEKVTHSINCPEMSRYYLDIDLREDSLRITGVLLIVLILGVLASLSKIPVGSFMTVVTFIVGYLVGRIRGRGRS